jgi:hypothetical protein
MDMKTSEIADKSLCALIAKIAMCSLISVQISACTGARELRVSRPDIVANTGVDSSGKIDFGDAQLYFRPTNQIHSGEGVNWFGVNDIKPVSHETWFSLYFDRKSSQILADGSAAPFYVEIYVESEKKFTLHPSTIFVQNGDRRTAPSSYLGPLRLHSKVNYALTLCTPDKTAKNAISSSISVDSGKSMCLALIFDMPTPYPEQRFQLDLGEIDVGSRKIKVPPISFVPRREASAHP